MPAFLRAHPLEIFILVVTPQVPSARMVALAAGPEIEGDGFGDGAGVGHGGLVYGFCLDFVFWSRGKRWIDFDAEFG